MGTANRKMPRRGHAEKLRASETTRKRDGADLQNGWWGRHGKLYLTDDRLLFHPTPIDTALGAKRREMLLDDIVEIERLPKNPDDMIPGGKRPRMIVHTAECGYEFLVPALDAWIATFEMLYARRCKNTQTPHVPVFVREGPTTGLLDIASLG